MYHLHHGNKNRTPTHYSLLHSMGIVHGWIPENQIRRMEAIEDESRHLL